ncbi:hypothetical protein [Natronomonas sp. LN261]|jgi:uncharacterized coiled-coil protein SlyX|uniref:DUF7518 family protein n=1 Tax=Natronomonas sp. LN261 TaxID=2750669 RepID=UPI0015EF4D76|nr:hypothetical protein [Natronomonas sp. LN261]
MSGNRVEELEAKVRELEATIDGLTDELVETKERLGAIEEEAGVEPDALERRRSRTSQDRDGVAEDAETDADADDTAQPADAADGDEDGDETADSAGDDIIVA